MVSNFAKNMSLNTYIDFPRHLFNFLKMSKEYCLRYF
ncbi:hypothetical protein CEDIAZO_00962 [Celerinatantimonas diazotrophica]|nr:hypothetical protein CEDIAZO_00962 [Celerinatantimonas diazotrophica]